MDLVWEMNDIVERTVEYAFQGKYMFCMYDYLKQNKATKRDVQEFVDGSTARSMQITIYDLEDYLEGGNDSEHKQLREAYGHLGKPEARKIKDYLYKILQDAWKYEQEKRPGRRRKASK